MQSQFDKWLKAKEEHNERQARRQQNRLVKNYEQLRLYSPSTSQLDRVKVIKDQLNN